MLARIINITPLREVLVPNDPSKIPQMKVSEETIFPPSDIVPLKLHPLLGYKSSSRLGHNQFCTKAARDFGATYLCRVE